MLQTAGILLCTMALVINGQQYQASHEMPTKGVRADAEFPCPDETLFLPCVCTVDGSDMNADCSNAQTDEDLATAFTVQQVFYTYKSLTISPDAVTNLDTFTKDTFGGVSFESIEITNTNLRVIEDGTFASSESTLKTLNLRVNAIEDFPFESLTRYTSLATLNLRNNFIGMVQDLESDSLVTLNMQNNPTLNISLGLFGSAPELKTLELHNCGIEDLTQDMFLPLEKIETIDLSGNLITQLRENAINNPQKTLTSLDLSTNPLYYINKAAITTAQLDETTAQLVLENTEFVELCEETWSELVNNLGEQSIKLAGNPLRCGCDIAWLFGETPLNTKLDSSTTCRDNSNVQDLDPDVFTVHCDPMPEGVCPAAWEQDPEIVQF